MEMIVSIGAMEPYREEASIRSPMFHSAGEMKLSCQQKAAMLCKESVTAGIYLLRFHLSVHLTCVGSQHLFSSRPFYG